MDSKQEVAPVVKNVACVFPPLPLCVCVCVFVCMCVCPVSCVIARKNNYNPQFSHFVTPSEARQHRLTQTHTHVQYLTGVSHPASRSFQVLPPRLVCFSKKQCQRILLALDFWLHCTVTILHRTFWQCLQEAPFQEWRRIKVYLSPPQGQVHRRVHRYIELY